MAKRPRGYSNSTLDNLWSARVKEAADYICEICYYNEMSGIVPTDPSFHRTDEDRLSSHHFYGRRNRSTRWWVPNGVCLCDYHHTNGVWSAHRNPAWFQNKMVDIRGKKWLDGLIQRASIVFKWQKRLVEIKEYLRREREDYLDDDIDCGN